MTTEHEVNSQGQQNSENAQPEREYEKSGMYPSEGKPFRMYALLGWLAVIVVVRMAAAAVLDLMLLPR